MNSTNALFSRRDFLLGTAGALAASAVAATDSAVIDPHKFVLISDVHVPLPWTEQKYRTGMEYPWVIPAIKKHIKEILDMRPRPCAVICLGDVSIAFSEDKEYEIAAQLFQPLEDVGIKIVMGVGNHDLRAPFRTYFPRWIGESPVKDKIMSVTHLADCDFVMLDSLVEPKKRGSYPACTGFGLGDEQTKWLVDFLAKAERPVLIGAHHQAGALKIDHKIARAPKAFGYFHGHHHQWMSTYLNNGYNPKFCPHVRSLGIPSFGIDRDIGYAIVKTSPTMAGAQFVENDYYFPSKPATDARSPLARDIIRDNSDRRVLFPFEKECLSQS